MRATLIAGLMVVGGLGGCGGVEALEQPAPSTADVRAQVTSCYEVCRAQFGLCMRVAQDDPRERQLCMQEYETCNEHCTPPSGARQE
ncbi:hypothetical protein [Corallococcus terminator]|uniref:Uncharacterized protein n=1 Tax=Corallococcus terminator TaxID=2316733 RepID=A0A3A8I783_9BACT|nr:hypothetical protein [Corallococcus terminator]RKG73553.1 hypothetical protein D7V88_36270 [Corallococcus terminator]